MSALEPLAVVSDFQLLVQIWAECRKAPLIFWTLFFYKYFKLRLSKIGKWMLSEQMARKHCPMHSMKHFQVLLTRNNILTKLHAEHVPKTFLAGLPSFRMFSIESHSPWFITFMCWAWTTPHKVYHNQQVKQNCKRTQFQGKLGSLVTLSLKMRYLLFSETS